MIVARSLPTEIFYSMTSWLVSIVYTKKSTAYLIFSKYIWPFSVLLFKEFSKIERNWIDFLSRSMKTLFLIAITVKRKVLSLKSQRKQKSVITITKKSFLFSCWILVVFKKTDKGIQTVSYCPYNTDERTPNISVLWQKKTHPSNSSCSQYQRHLVSNNFSIQAYFYLRITYYFTLK